MAVHSNKFVRVAVLATVILSFPCIGATVDPKGRPQINIRNEASNTAVGAIVIDRAITILVDSEEPGPILKAAQNLAADIEKTFGKRPRIVNRLEDAGAVTILIGESSRLPQSIPSVALVDHESFSIFAAPIDRQNLPRIQAVVLSGADMRGTIYAIYQFAEEFLGIDPMYFWTDHTPSRQKRIALPSSLNKRFPSPVFKYRGFFINDEDLLTGWAPGKRDGTGISLAVWDKIFETILRLKGNMVVPGTWVFSDDAQVKLAGQRGLIISQHHAEPLGLNVGRWPLNVPYSYTEHSDILRRAWKNAAAAYDPQQEVLWTVGLRGLTDQSYAEQDPKLAGNRKALGKLISRAISEQISIVRSIRPSAQFMTVLWSEGVGLAQDGYLTMPAEVTQVWSDDGYGHLRDQGAVARGQGAYYHVAMLNFRANQLSDMVPVARIYGELSRYIQAGATQYLLLNTSDIRPVAMTARAVMDVAWKGMDRTDEAFYSKWSAQQFGPRAAPTMVQVYRDYFAAPARRRSPVSDRSYEYGDMYYHTKARLLLLAHMNGLPLYVVADSRQQWVVKDQGDLFAYRPEMIGEEIQRCGAAQPRWDALWKKALAAESLIDPGRKPFYRGQVLSMIQINRQGNRLLFLVASALEEARAGRIHQANALAEQALRAVQEIKEAQASAEYGRWKNWYRGDWLVGVERTGEFIQSFISRLRDPSTRVLPPILWTTWEGYHHMMQHHGDRRVDVQ